MNNLDVITIAFLLIFLWITFLVNVSYFVDMILFVVDWVENKVKR